MNLARIEELIELMRRSNVMELSLDLPDCKVRIRRAEGSGAAEAAPPPPGGQPVSAAPAPEVVQAPAASLGAELPVPVPSPVVGVFRSNGPQGRKATAAGDRVAKGGLLATVEAMKVPNEVRSPAGGTVAAVLVEEGQPVEFGQTLFTVVPEEGGEADESEPPVGVA